MYGQTGSGKTFTMMGPHNSTYSNMSTSFQEISKTEMSTTPRGRYDSVMSTEKIPLSGRTQKNLSVFDGNNAFESSRTLFKANNSSRNKSPMMSRDKTPIRLADKSPIKMSKVVTPGKNFEQLEKTRFENESENKMNIEDKNYVSNLHKRASTMNFASFGPISNQSENSNNTNSNFNSNTNSTINNFNSNNSSTINNFNYNNNSTINNYSSNNSILNKKPSVDSSSIIGGVSVSEQEIIKNYPENSEGILVLALKDIFANIEEVID